MTMTSIKSKLNCSEKSNFECIHEKLINTVRPSHPNMQGLKVVHKIKLWGEKKANSNKSEPKKKIPEVSCC